MKKVLVLFLIMVAFTISVFSINPNERIAFSKLYNKSTFKELARYLDVDYEQANQLKYVFLVSDDNLRLALKSGDEPAAEKAIWYSIGNARSILSEKQYTKFLMVLYNSIYSENETFLTKN